MDHLLQKIERSLHTSREIDKKMCNDFTRSLRWPYLVRSFLPCNQLDIHRDNVCL